VKVSQKLDNACRVLVQLAIGYDGKRVYRVEDLARKEEISPNFLLQILNELRKGGVVISRRGKLGGYMLSRPPHEISLCQVVSALEGPLLDGELRAGGQSGATVVAVWEKVNRELEGILEGITLDHMTQMGTDQTMYYI